MFITSNYNSIDDQMHDFLQQAFCSSTELENRLLNLILDFCEPPLSYRANFAASMALIERTDS